MVSAIVNLSTIFSNMNADAPDFSWLPTADSSILVDTQRIAAAINVLFFKVFCHSKSFQLWREFLIVLEFSSYPCSFRPSELMPISREFPVLTEVSGSQEFQLFTIFYLSLELYKCYVL